MLIFLYYIAIIALLLVSSIFNFNYSKGIVELLLVLNGVSILMFLFRREKYEFLKKQYLKHSYFILIGFVIVYFQFPLDLVLGYQSEFDNKSFVQSSLIVPNLIIVSIGLHAFFIGYIISDFKLSNVSLGEPAKKKKITIVPSYLLDFFTLIMLLGYFATINPLYFMGGYSY